MAEHQHIEWKETWRDEYLKWISGFSNADGGMIVIGKNDKGEIIGIDNAKKLMEDLPNKAKNMLGVLPEVNLKTEGDLEYIEIIIEPSKSPVTYKGQFYIRRGSTNQLLDGIALSDFVLEKSNIDWDEIAVPNATLDDIDIKAIETFKREARKSGRVPSINDDTTTEDVLRNLKLINDEGHLKRAAVLLFCKEPHNFLITANVKIGRFGETHSDLRSQEFVEGNHFEIADKVINILDFKYIIRNITYDGLKRLETPEYPFEAIREAIFNAIIHRKYDSTSIYISVYDDRLEIWNEGLLHESLTVDDLKRKHRSHPRNPLMANVLYKAGFIETWGRGTIKIIEEAKKYNLPEPKIHQYSGGVAVTLFKQVVEKNQSKINSSEIYNSLTENQRKIVEFMEKHGKISAKDYANFFSVTDRTALRHLEELIKLEIVDKIGESRGTRYVLK